MAIVALNSQKNPDILKKLDELDAKLRDEENNRLMLTLCVRIVFNPRS
jgi:hypothetical protein